MSDFVPGRGVKKPSAEELNAVLDFRDMVRSALVKN
jgi:hypothetical protein